MPNAFKQAKKFLDLADFLLYKATRQDGQLTAQNKEVMRGVGRGRGADD